MEGNKITDQISFSDFLINVLKVIVKKRKFLSRFIVVSTTAAVILAFALPKWYEAKVSVFPAVQSQLPTGIEGIGMLSQVFSASKAFASLSGNPDLDRYMVILKSSSVLSSVINKFDLVRVYDITTYPMEKTGKELLSNTEFSIEPEGNLTIAVFDKDPQRAADMANFFVQELNRVNAELLVANATATRQFIEQRYNKNIEDLRKSEDELRAYQEKTKTMIIPVQSASSISAIGEFYAMKAKKEIERAILEQTVGKDDALLRQTTLEITEIEKKIATIPATTIESFRLYRNVAIQQKVLEFLTPVLEQAKVEEKRQTPSVIVIDKAGPPERKAKPKVSIFGLMGFALSLIVGLFIVFLSETIESLREKYPKAFADLSSSIRDDWFGLRPFQKKD